MRQSISKSVAHSKRKRVDEQDVGFYEDPLNSRPVNTAESWAAYHFERHARKCAYCYNPYEVYRHHEHLCEIGHDLAQQLARYMYQESDGLIYSTVEKDSKLVPIRVPVGYVEVCGLLKAVERSKRHRSRRPFVHMDRSHDTTPRTNLGVPDGRVSPVPAPDSEEPLPLSKTSRTNPGFIAEMTLVEPSGSQMLAEHYREIEEGTYADSASEGSASETIDSLSEDSASDAELSRSTGSEIQDRLGAQETIPNMDPWDSHSIIPSDQSDNVSVASSDEGSVFSVSSLASSATDLSKGSGYSAVQIATATRELLSIFRDDQVLQPLYTTAIHGVIGPQKFVNKFRRLLKAFAERLKDEAQDRLDFLAARLVALKAREIANAVLERYQLGRAPDLDLEEGRGDTALGRDDRDSSDEDEPEETNVDETVFEELTNVREFLVHSAAFKSLQADLQQFVTSKRRSKKHSKKPAIEQQDDPNPEEGTYRVYLDASPQLAEFSIENDCFDMLRHDRPLLELYLYVFCALGIDRFVDEYSELLRYHCTNAHALVQNKVNDWMSGSVDKQPITIWQVIASAVALHLESADANLSYEKHQRCGASADTSFLLELLSRERKALDWPAPYHHLNRDLALLTLRGPLQQLLSHIPKRAMELSSKNDTSFVNTSKAFLEDYTITEWDWWPLAPRVPDVKYGESRLQWKFGGTRLYETLSSLECNIIRFAMPSLPNHPKQCSCCHIESPGKTSSAASPQPVNLPPEPQPSQWCLSLPMTWIKAAAGTAANSSNSSTASQRYTPTNPSATSITGTNSAAAGGTSTNPSAINNSNSMPQIAGQPATNPSIVLLDLSLRVLFGVQGSRWSLEVEQISTALLNDPAFFRELKTRYKKHRHWIKRLVSPFRFRFCRFVKLEKFDTGRVLSQGDDLPDYPGVKDDYEYDPRPGTNPMISPKTFAVCLKACDMNCKWPWINPWHDCVSLPCRSYRLGCIPKKKTEFDIQSDDAIAVAWGLEADHAISFAFMAVYHLVPLLAAFGFWIYWLIKFPGDWQNAAVPVLTVLAIFAVLWVPFGKHLGIV